MSSTSAPQNTPAMFPIQAYWPERDYPQQVRRIPWALIAPCEGQALSNHGQTLQRLAERQGLCAMEAVAVLDGMSFHDRWKWSTKEGETRKKQLEAIRLLNERVEAFSVLGATENHLAAQDNQNSSLSSHGISSSVELL